MISLDTPHQTPTTIQPPQPFCNSPIQSLSSSKGHSSQQAITLDPAALQQEHRQQGYANVKMINSETMENDNSKYNGTMNNNNNNINNNNIPKEKNQPFSIQGYSDGYKENHSEISC